MTDREFFAVSDGPFPIAQELLEGPTIHGTPYLNIQVTTDHPEFTDIYDPDVGCYREVMSFYWPGGSPYHSSYDYEAIHLDEDGRAFTDALLAEETMMVRRAILGASIGRTALDRVPAATRQTWENMKLIDPTPILMAKATCALEGLPLGVLQTSRVEQSELIPRGKRMLHLWYPVYISPKPVLTAMKKVVREVMDEESIT